MNFLATSLIYSKDNFVKDAKGKGGLLGKIFVREPLYDLALEYKPYYKIHLPHDIVPRRLFVKKKKISGVADMIVDCQTGACAVMTEQINLFEASGKIFCEAMPLKKPEKAVEIAKRYASRVLLGLSGGMPTFQESSLEMFYRPHWIAYYGNPDVCANPKYLPYEADGLFFYK